MHVLWRGERLFCDHGFYQLSADNGKTWNDGHLLKYGDGPDFDPEDWGNPEYFRTNEMYIGETIIHSNGRVVLCATVPVEYRDEEDEKVPVVFPNTYRDGCVAGVMCFIGSWDAGKKDYCWETSQHIFLPRRISTRGLVELNLSELSNGDILLIMRGSNAGLDPSECPGRKWMSLSSDGGDWVKLTETPLWQGISSHMSGEWSHSEELSGLKFGFPSMIQLSDKEVFAVFWCLEECIRNIRWIRIEV